MAATVEYIKELVKDRKDAFAGLHKQIEANRDLRYNRHEIKIPKAYENSTQEVRSPIVADIFYRVVATLTTDDPTISVPPYSATDKAKRNASLRERWSQASLERMMRDASRDVLRMGIDAAVADGLGVWKIIDRKDAWKAFPKRKQDEDPEDYLERTDRFAKGRPYPFTWIDVDPLSYFPVSSGFGVTEVAEVTTRALLPAMKQFGVKRAGGKWEKLQPGEPMPEGDSKSSSTIECIEHWDDEAVTYLLDGEKVDQRACRYGRPPYFSLGGHTTSSRKPEEQYNSIIQPFAHLIPALDAMLTMLTNYGYLTAYPFLRKMEGAGNIAGPEDPDNVVHIEPGTVLQNVEFMPAPGTGNALKDVMGLFNQMIDRSGLASVMYGQGGGTSSGYMVAQLMTAAQLVYAPIVDNARMALEQMIPFLWQLVEKRMKRKVFVWGAGTAKGAGEWMGLGPDDIDGYYACEVALKPLLPMDEIAQRDSALRMVNGGIWSKEHAREHTGLEQPEEEADQIAVEQYMESPKINELIIQDAAERAGLVKPEPPAPPAPPQLLDQYGQPMQIDPNTGQPMQTGMPQNLGGFGASPAIQPNGGTLMPGQGLPMQPNMPVGVQRLPAGNPRVGPV